MVATHHQPRRPPPRRPSQCGPLRPSWCYGTPGISRALQLSALALGDSTRRRLAERAFVACIDDPTQTGQLTDRSLCHGTAGLLTTARRIATDALTPIPSRHYSVSTSRPQLRPANLKASS
ncbi:lanthionine synthetase LanC family protein [Micromonospora sp. M12]